MRYKHFLIFVALTLKGFSSFAGLQWADVGVNGLTCSMCSRSVEMSLRRLDFVEKVTMSLESTEGRIFFKSGMPINLNDIAQAIVNAGFSVRFLKLQMTFDDIPLHADGSFAFQGQSYQWIDFQNNAKGSVALKLVDENFLPRKENATWKKKYTKTSQNILHVVQG